MPSALDLPGPGPEASAEEARAYVERLLVQAWTEGALLADICIAMGQRAPDVMAHVRRLGLDDRHPTTRLLEVGVAPAGSESRQDALWALLRPAPT